MRARDHAARRAQPRRPTSRRHLRYWRPAAAFATLLLVAAAGVEMWRVGLPAPVAAFLADAVDRGLTASARSGLSVRDILVTGRHETPIADVLAALAVQRGAPMLAFDPAGARNSLEQLAWVKRASVERRLAGTIHVGLVERQPLALWQRQGRVSVIDLDGEEIRGAELGRFVHLPLVVGDDAAKHAQAILALLATEPDVAGRVAASVRVGGRRWNLRLDNGIDVQLPEMNAGAAWTRLAELVRQDGLLDRDVRVVDLRLPDRLILRTSKEVSPPAPTKRGKGGRST